MKWTVVFALAAGLWLWGAGPSLETANHAEAKERMTVEEFKKWTHEIERRTRQLQRMDTNRVKWGKETKATRSNMIVLDQPVIRRALPGFVHVEWFSRWVDNDGNSVASLHARKLTGIDWARSMLEESNIPVLYENYVLTKGPGLSEEFDDARTMLQELASTITYGWPASNDKNITTLRKKILRMAMDGELQFVKRRVDVERLVREAGVDKNEWEEIAEDVRGRWRQFVEARWKAIAENAMKQDPTVFENVPDPIILINGKYLITQNTMRRQGGMNAPERVLKAANWLIRTEWERDPQYGFDEDKITWRNERKPRRKQMIELNPAYPDPDPDKVNVEWLYTYISEDGQKNERRWLDETLKVWMSSIHRSGIFDVKLTKTPAGQWSKKDNQWTQHHRLHQELVMAWGKGEELTRSAVHSSLTSILFKHVRSISTHEGTARVLEQAGTNENLWRQRSDSEQARKRMADATARALATGKKGEDPRGPVFVIDGKYRIDGNSAGGTVETFQILNWAIRKRLEQIGK